MGGFSVCWLYWSRLPGLLITRPRSSIRERPPTTHRRKSRSQSTHGRVRALRCLRRLNYHGIRNLDGSSIRARRSCTDHQRQRAAEHQVQHPMFTLNQPDTPPASTSVIALPIINPRVLRVPESTEYRLIGF